METQTSQVPKNKEKMGQTCQDRPSRAGSIRQFIFCCDVFCFKHISLDEARFDARGSVIVLSTGNCIMMHLFKSAANAHADREVLQPGPLASTGKLEASHRLPLSAYFKYLHPLDRRSLHTQAEIDQFIKRIPERFISTPVTPERKFPPQNASEGFLLMLIECFVPFRNA